MSELTYDLISGKEALIALANGEEVECRAYEKNWVDAGNHNHNIGLFFDGGFQFRIKPRTITINNIEVPAPFEPKEGDIVFVLDNANTNGFSSFTFDSDFLMINFGAWRTEEEIKQVVAAPRNVFGGNIN